MTRRSEVQRALIGAALQLAYDSLLFLITMILLAALVAVFGPPANPP
jgi:uncharacterized metal-binding protein